MAGHDPSAADLLTPDGHLFAETVELFPNGWLRAHLIYEHDATTTASVDLLFAPGEVLAVVSRLLRQHDP